MDPWHILVVSALSNARQFVQNQYVVHKIPGRLYDNKTVAEFKETLSLRFSSLIKDEKKSLPKGVDEHGCVLSVHDADTLVKLMVADNVQEMASDRRLFRVVALVPQVVFEALREIHGSIPDFTAEQLEERVGVTSSPRTTSNNAIIRKRSAGSAFNQGLPANGHATAAAEAGVGRAMPLTELPPGIGPQPLSAQPMSRQAPQHAQQQDMQQGQTPVVPWQAQGKTGTAQQAQRGREERPPMTRQQGAPQRGRDAQQAQRQDSKQAQQAGAGMGPGAGHPQPQLAPGGAAAPGTAAAAAAAQYGGAAAGPHPHHHPHHLQQQPQQQQQEFVMAAQQAGRAVQGYGGGTLAQPDHFLQQVPAHMAEYQGQYVVQQQGAAAPALPPHLQAQHAQQQALLQEQQAQMEMYRRQQAAQGGGMFWQGPWG